MDSSAPVVIRGTSLTRPSHLPILCLRPKAPRNSSSMCSCLKTIGLQFMTLSARRKNRERPKTSIHNLKKSELPGASHDLCGFWYHHALG